MKTAISIPDQVFRRAERLAKRLGISRSELYTRAMEQFLSERQGASVTASYDRAFGPDVGTDNGEKLRRKAVRKALRDIEW